MRVYLFILLGVCMALFIWFLFTTKGREWSYRYANRLRANNNTRAMLCWIVTGTLFIFHLLICTVGSQWPVGLNVSTPHYSERTQKFLKLYEQKMPKPTSVGGTAQEVAKDVWTSASKVVHSVYDAICWFLGYTVFFFTIFSAIYTVIALRDEFMSAWEETKDKIFGPKGGEQNLPDVITPQGLAAPTQQQSGQTNPLTAAGRKPLYLSNYLTYEFIFALIGELTNLFIHRRRM